MRKKKSLTSTDAPIPNSVDPVATDYSPENNRCIKCNKVGKMLVCSEVGPSKPSTHLRGSHPPILVKKEVTNVHPPSRKRLMWTADEEQMLKICGSPSWVEAMGTKLQNFSVREILLFGV